MFWVSFAGASLWGASASSASLPEAISWVSTEMSYPQGSIPCRMASTAFSPLPGSLITVKYPSTRALSPSVSDRLSPVSGVEAHGYDIAV